jgi:iron complex outermembrane receptor protein
MNSNSRQVAIAVSSILAMSSTAWAAAPAPADTDITLEEVIVTAQFREENLQDTPIAITAVTGDKLEEQGLTSVQDLGLIIPNANMRQPGAGSGPNASIGMRGVNTSEFIYTTDPGVGVYIDDVYHGTLSGSDMDLLDVERVEVLRGPQGTLFGKNSLGGAIRMISKKPRGDDSGNIDLTYGSSNRLDLKASYDFALTEKLFMRVSGVSKQIDGYQDVLDFACQMRVNGTPALSGTFPTFVPSNSGAQGNCKIGEKGGSELNAGRVMFRLQATEDLEFNLNADYSKTVAQAPVQSLLTQYDPTGLNWLYVSSQSYGVLPDSRFLTGDPFKTYSWPTDPVDGKVWPVDQVTDAWSTTGKVDYDISQAVHLKLIGAYRTYDSIWLGDGDDLPFDLNHTYNEQSHEQTTLEAQLTGQAFDSRFDWTTGLYYYDSKSVLGGYVTLPAFAIFNIQNFNQNDHFTTKSKSAFVHGVYKLSDAMSLTAGARITDETKTYQFDHTNFLTVADPLNYGSSHFDWKVSLDYRFNPNLMAYGLVSTGFRSDGAQPRPFTPGQQQTPTTAEEIIAYEVGLKSDFFDRRLRINASAFLNDYDPRVASGFGLQCNTFNDPDPGPIFQGVPTCPPGTPLGNTVPPSSFLWFFYTSAPGEAKGLELEATATPVQGLDLSATLGYYKYSTGVAPGQDGYIHPSVREQPELSGALGAQYTIQLGGGTLVPRLDLFHQGERTNGPQNQLQRKPDNIVPSYNTVNARVTYLSADRKWRASLAADNLFDKFYYSTLGASTTLNPSGSAVAAFQRSGVPGRGREISINLRRSF